MYSVVLRSQRRAERSRKQGNPPYELRSVPQCSYACGKPVFSFFTRRSLEQHWLPLRRLALPRRQEFRFSLSTFRLSLKEKNLNSGLSTDAPLCSAFGKVGLF
ncbi:MAG: hypothetical protein PUP93_23095 [Rhizonema sp. NSF051]|nr:hypothetical protein [Rhizonema sp. NSF051]